MFGLVYTLLITGLLGLVGDGFIHVASASSFVITPLGLRIPVGGEQVGKSASAAGADSSPASDGAETSSRNLKFQPGVVPGTDENGRRIQAHGGCLLEHEGAVYWYGENKDGDTKQLSIHTPARVDVVGISVYRTTDFNTWTYEGLALKPDTSDRTSDIHTSKVVERPKVVYNRKTKTFVMLLHIDTADYTYAQVGVATSDSPTGPFQYHGSARPHGWDARDMTVFVDDDEDNTGYLVYSSEDNRVSHIGKLTEDYTGLDGSFARVFVGQSREAPTVFKNGGLYYMVTSGCTGWAPNRAMAHVATCMLCKWKSLGDPSHGSSGEMRASTFYSQGTYVFGPLRFVDGDGTADGDSDELGRFLFLADRWNPKDLRTSTYVWLPMTVRTPAANATRLKGAPPLTPDDAMLWSSVRIRYHEAWDWQTLRDAGAGT